MATALCGKVPFSVEAICPIVPFSTGWAKRKLREKLNFLA
jgi:hypothetical protein